MKCVVYINENGFMHANIEVNENVSGFAGNIEIWLTDDVQTSASGKMYLKYLKHMLKSKDQNEILRAEGNACRIHVTKDITTILYIYEEYNPTMVPCTLPTVELIKILKVWIRAKRKREIKSKIAEIFKK